MPRVLDITGQRFGRLVALRRSNRKDKGGVWWECACDCGKSHSAPAGWLRSGNTLSCGCGQRDAAKRVCIERSTHRGSQSRLYVIWKGMKQRCQYKGNIGYHRYGGKGVRLCDDWQNFAPFEGWARAHGYDDTLTIERQDNDGDYCPGNCSWIPGEFQHLNRSSSVKLTFDGRTQNMSQWADELGIKRSCLAYRISTGWPVDLALTTPVVPGGVRRCR